MLAFQRFRSATPSLAWFAAVRRVIACLADTVVRHRPHRVRRPRTLKTWGEQQAAVLVEPQPISSARDFCAAPAHQRIGRLAAGSPVAAPLKVPEQILAPAGCSRPRGRVLPVGQQHLAGSPSRVQGPAHARVVGGSARVPRSGSPAGRCFRRRQMRVPPRCRASRWGRNFFGKAPLVKKSGGAPLNSSRRWPRAAGQPPAPWPPDVLAFERATASSSRQRLWRGSRGWCKTQNPGGLRGRAPVAELHTSCCHFTAAAVGRRTRP